ncbi:MAG: hypothetical protein R8G33_03510 [Gammaproteobacteria bacterium]|nr:hypothetical protein [Gammaproteobacteria bacterium]
MRTNVTGHHICNAQEFVEYPYKNVHDFLMQILTYKLVKYPNEYEAICEQFPYIAWIADTPEDALQGVEELAFQFYKDGIISLR